MTDTARTTKDERDHWRELRTFPYTITAEKARRLLDDADAADALRAQVAALQAENERLWRGLSAARGEATFHAARTEFVEAELAAAQANLAVPVDDDVMFDAEYLRHSAEQLNTASPICLRNIADRHESLARDNAALRTKAEALERERDQARSLFDTMSDLYVNELGPEFKAKIDALNRKH